MCKDCRKAHETMLKFFIANFFSANEMMVDFLQVKPIKGNEENVRCLCIKIQT